MPTPSTAPATEPASVSLPSGGSRATGLWFAVGAYGLWGVLPLYFLLLAPAGAFEIVAARILFSLVFCAILLTATRGWSGFVALLRQRDLLLTMGLAGVLIYVNWQVYVLAATSGRLVEASLGYFINPIVTIVLGVVVLHERLRVAQWVAVGISVLAVVVLAVGYGEVPWVALILAFSFGFYGLVKKRVGPRVDAVGGLTLESLWLAPVAVVQLIVVANVSGLTFAVAGAGHAVLMASAGVLTAVPLLFFAGAARRLPLVVMGFVQYLAPILQLIVGVVVAREAMPPERWFGFGLVWIALVVLSSDAILAGRRSRARALSADA